MDMTSNLVPNTRPSIELHIESLVVHGFEPHDGHRLKEAVARRLAELLSEHGLPEALSGAGGIESIDAGEIRMAPGSKPEATGGQVARAVFGGLGR